MESKLARILGMTNAPVAVLYRDAPPAGAVTGEENRCVVWFLNQAAQGKTAALSEATIRCPGGRMGAGFWATGRPGIERILSTGTENRPGERYKKTPALARDHMDRFPPVTTRPWLILKPLSAVEPGEEPACVVFLVDPARLSALATLAGYDTNARNQVISPTGSGCVQALRYGVWAQQQGVSQCFIGITDPTARKNIPPDALSFTLPFRRFLELEEQAEESFLRR